MIPVGVECTFDQNGRVNVRRVYVDERWEAVSQGRQWFTESGRHVLVMFSSDQIEELTLSADDLVWRLARARRPQVV
jgi:hypothetical protein